MNRSTLLSTIATDICTGCGITAATMDSVLDDIANNCVMPEDLTGGGSLTSSITTLDICGGKFQADATGALSADNGNILLGGNLTGGTPGDGSASFAQGNFTINADGTANASGLTLSTDSVVSDEELDGVIAWTPELGGTALVMRQLGDEYGPTQLVLLNRDGANGAMFQNLGVGLVDFLFLNTSTPNPNYPAILRNESRSGYLVSPNTNELQLWLGDTGTPNTSSLAVGDEQARLTVPLVLADYTKAASPSEGALAWDFTHHVPVVFNGTHWYPITLGTHY
jgi:hypothetical protein